MCHYTTTCTTAENCTNMGKGNTKKKIQSVAGDMEKEFLQINCDTCFLMS